MHQGGQQAGHTLAHTDSRIKKGVANSAGGTASTGREVSRKILEATTGWNWIDSDSEQYKKLKSLLEEINIPVEFNRNMKALGVLSVGLHSQKLMRRLR